MSKILILLDTINYTTYKGNPHFRHLCLNQHYESALEFKKKYPLTTIIRNNYKVALNKFISTSENKQLIIVYCGHGNPQEWCIGISRNYLLTTLNKISNPILIVSDSCYSDTMNIANSRKNTKFISAARSTGINSSAYFTSEGGYLSCAFYKWYPRDFKILWQKILSEYYDDGGSNNHQPKLFGE